MGLQARSTAAGRPGAERREPVGEDATPVASGPCARAGGDARDRRPKFILGRRGALSGPPSRRDAPARRGGPLAGWAQWHHSRGPLRTSAASSPDALVRRESFPSRLVRRHPTEPLLPHLRTRCSSLWR